jgi:chitinase
MASTERFVAYWTGYANHGITLPDNPEFIQYVNLFLINLDSKTALNTDYITSDGMSWAEILEGARSLQSRGQKVLASVMSTPTYFWNSIESPAEFAKQAVSLVVDEWGLDGIDIDPEMSKNNQPFGPNQNFIDVVEALRSALGDQKLLTFVSYQLFFDGPLLKQNAKLFDYVALMGYFWDTQEMQSQFNAYAPAYVPPENLLLGVSPADPQTPLDEVRELCSWEPSGGQKGGMMLFATPYDIEEYSGQPQWTYCKTINQNMPTP